MKKLELHWQILIGMVLGIIFGFAMTSPDWGSQFVQDWINPFGTIFVKLLKLIAIPLILASLIKGISDLKDRGKDNSHLHGHHRGGNIYRTPAGQYHKARKWHR